MLAETEHPATSVADAISSASKAVAAATPAETAEDRASARRAVLKTEAQAAAPSAIAAATTEHERDLIGRIFNAIPSVIALSQAHSEADASNAPSLDSDRNRWEEARTKVEAMAVEVTALPPECAADALRRVLLYRQVIAWTEGAPLSQGFEGVFEEDMQVMGGAAIKALERLAAPPPDRTTWNAALARFHEAKSAYEDISAQWDALDDAITARAPAWNRRPRECDGKPLLRWSSLQNFETDRDRLPHMREKVVDWATSEAEALEELHQVGTAIDSVYDQFCDAERALIQTPAPDLAAVVFKQQRFGIETDDEKQGYADLAYAAARRDASYVAESWPLWIHEDILRLAGVNDPLLTTDHFKPRDWKRRFEAVGGKAHVTPIKHDLKIDLPHNPGPASVLLAELAAPGATETLTRYLLELR